MIDEKKLERQKIGVRKWFNNNCKGTLNYFTGVGKTYTAILCLKEYFEKNPLHNVTILLPSDTVKQQWYKELIKEFGKTLINQKITLITGDTALNNKTFINTHLLIVDELDAFYSDKKIHLINNYLIRAYHRLGLTATYKDTKQRHLKIKDFFPVIDKITEEEAIREGYVSKYVEFNLGLKLSLEEEQTMKNYSDRISKDMSKFGKNGLDLAGKCLSGGTHLGTRYDAFAFCKGWAQKQGWHPNLNLKTEQGRQIDGLWNPKRVQYYAISLFRNIRKRKEILYNNSSKLQACFDILKKIEDVKTVVFSQSTDFANTLYSIVSADNPDNVVMYHSKIPTQYFPSPVTGKKIKFGKVRLKRRCLERLNNNLSNHLITSSAFDKGLNVPSLKVGITSSGTQNVTQYQQRNGRTIRINPFEEDKTAILINLYIKESQDQKWLESRQFGSKNKIHWIDNIDEINLKKYITNEKIE